ncbi:mechanosensitive ion channel family protein [Achromobacter sp. Marseille-Q4962]|uniref:mechanosensitive ion channel family protein n=1 Tax=Achromobacter sp. Marseille-Q4962 TaxID=2942202 RepID=UPI0020746DD3|nr:mechanosensitive ion channel family protein [Achromobacter sp. Marseille-Q4962]
MDWNHFTGIGARLKHALQELGGRIFDGLTLDQVILSAAILIAAFALRWIFTRTRIHRIGLWLLRARTPAAQALVKDVAPAVRFVPFVAAAFAISGILSLTPAARGFVFDFNRALVVFTLFWALLGAIPSIFAGLEARSTSLGDGMTGWIVRVARIVTFLLGAGIILEIWNIHVGPVLAGLGLVGAAVALGAQDLFKNLIAGVFIIGEQRFESGDWIRVDGVVEGTVEIIGLRATTVRRFDLAPVMVPNSKLADNALINFSKMTYRRISWTIGLEYRTSVDQLRRIRDDIEAYIKGSDAFVSAPAAPTFVRIDSFGDSSIDLMVYCFTRTTNWGEWLQIKETFAYAIKNIVEGAGSGFAFPSRSLYVETMPSGAEVFPLQARAPQTEQAGDAGPVPPPPRGLRPAPDT